MDAADRGKLMFTPGRPGRRKRRRAGRPRIAQQRQNDQRRPRRRAGRAQHAAVLRRLGRQDRRPHRSRPRQLPLVHAAAAGRRRRADHSLELPAVDAGLEVGSGPGLRQHDRDEARRADAAHRHADGRTGSRSRFSRRRDQRPQRHGRDDRRRDGGPSGHRQDRLHRARRHGQDHLQARRPTRSSGARSSWAARAPT